MKGKTPGLTIFRAESVEFFLFIEQKVENWKNGRTQKMMNDLNSDCTTIFDKKKQISNKNEQKWKINKNIKEKSFIPYFLKFNKNIWIKTIWFGLNQLDLIYFNLMLHYIHLILQMNWINFVQNI